MKHAQLILVCLSTAIVMFALGVFFDKWRDRYLQQLSGAFEGIAILLFIITAILVGLWLVL